MFNPVDAEHTDITTLLLANIFVDSRYQREPIPTHVRKLVRECSPRTAMLLAVNLRADNTIALIDGQHRMLAMRELGYRSWDAYCWSGLSVAEEAVLFLQLNKDRRHHTAIGRWRAELTAGNDLVRTLDQIIVDCGFTLRASRRRFENPWYLNCPDALLLIASPARSLVGQPEQVRTVLMFIARTWPNDPFMSRRLVVTGVDLFLRRYGSALDMRAAMHRFSAIPLSDLYRTAITIRDGEAIHAAAAFARALQRTYDRRRTTGRLEVDPDRSSV